MKFAILPESVLIDQRLTKNDLRVLLALLCHANKKGYCWPSRSALGVMLNVDDRKVSVITGRLCKYGYLSKIKNYVRPNGQCVTFAYHVKVTEPVTVGGVNLRSMVKFSQVLGLMIVLRMYGLLKQ